MQPVGIARDGSQPPTAGQPTQRLSSKKAPLGLHWLTTNLTANLAPKHETATQVLQTQPENSKSSHNLKHLAFDYILTKQPANK